MTAPVGRLLSPAPAQYSKHDQDQIRLKLDQRDAENVKHGQEYQPVRFVMTSPDGARWLMGVSNLGVTTWTAL